MATPIHFPFRRFASRQPSERARPSAGFLVIFVVGFLAFFAIGVVAQLLILPWRRWLPGAESETSLIGSVKASVYTFMGYLN